MRILIWILLAWLAMPALAVAGDPPIRLGRWSNTNCARPTAASTRFFSVGHTSTLGQTCVMAGVLDQDGTYRAHLTCHAKTTADTDDVVLKVSSPTTLTWINQCMAVEYRFCSP